MTNERVDKKVLKKLTEVLDPELFVSIVDLGLVYNIKVKGKKAYITMTLTTIGCPLFATIEELVKSKVTELEEVDKVTLELTFDPPWSMDRMSERGKAMLGL